MLPKVGETIMIQSYKHDESLHRIWNTSLIIESNVQQIVAVTDRTIVFESNNHSWLTKEPAICFFYPDKWYNIIAMFKKTGIVYYCNIASPSLYDGEAIKNIDYDLDVKVLSDNSMILLDQQEYKTHSAKYHYPENIKEIIDQQLEKLITEIKTKKGPFNDSYIHKYYQLYMSMK